MDNFQRLNVKKQKASFKGTYRHAPHNDILFNNRPIYDSDPIKIKIELKIPTS